MKSPDCLDGQHDACLGCPCICHAQTVPTAQVTTDAHGYNSIFWGFVAVVAMLAVERLERSA